jgi:Ankyrin repeats (3 copies)
MVRDTSLGTVYCVVDGLDECDEPLLEVLLKRSRALFSTRSNLSPSCHLNLIAISRERPDSVAKELSGFPHIRLGPDSGITVDRDVKSDVSKFIAAKVGELSEYRNYPPQLRSYVENILHKRSEGTFLWVGIVAKELEKYACDEVKDALDTFPSGLLELYSRILLQFPLRRRKPIAKILQWVVMAARPLTIKELGAALGLADDASSGLTCKAAALEQVKNCGHLLTTTRRKSRKAVGLIHQSAKDYLLRETFDPNPDLEFFRVKKDVANYEIAKKCLDYLHCGALAYGPINLRLKAFPFLSYAALHWFEHARVVSDPTLDIFDLSLPLYHDGSEVRVSWILSCKISGSNLHLPESSPLLHVASYLGVVPLAERLLCESTQLGYRRLDVNEGDTKERTALHFAVQSARNEAIVRLLLRKGADPEAIDKRKRTVLFQAVQSKNQEITQILLEEGVNPNSQDQYRETALHRAARTGRETLVQLLLEHGADPNAQDERKKNSVTSGDRFWE